MKYIFIILFITLVHSLFDNFEGNWKGIPITSIVGPFNNNFTFHITKINNNEWLFNDYIENYNTGGIKGTSQKWWYVDNILWYCGILVNFFTIKHPRYAKFPFVIKYNNSNKIIFCNMDNGCDYMKWELNLLSKNKLHSIMYMPPPIRHLDVIYNRIYSLKHNIKYNKLITNYDFKCNFTKKITNNYIKCPFSYINKKFKTNEKKNNKNCYILNKKLDFRIYWKIYNKYIDISISSITNGWISIGFQGNNNYLFTMNNTDIILGYIDKNNNYCIKNLYSNNIIGIPNKKGNIMLLNKSISYINNRLTLNFTRLLKSGRHNINNNNDDFQVLWAIGNNNNNTNCNTLLNYHGPNRGFRNINWFNPELSFVNNIKC
jgi:hypothetical protein